MRRPWIVWLLLLALPVCGIASVAAGLLGTSHVHRTAPVADVADVSLQDFRRQSDNVVGFAEPHRHSVWQRHHHASVDPTVVALEGDAQESSSNEGASSWVSLFAICPVASGLCVPALAEGPRRWPGAGASAIATMAVIPLERPPKA